MNKAFSAMAQRRWLTLVVIIVLAAPALAAQVAGVGDGFGYDAGTGVMTNHDGLRYFFRGDGTIKVMDGNGQTLSFVGLGVRGRVGENWFTKYVTDFSWTWNHDIDEQGNHYFNAAVNQTNYDWKASIVFFADATQEMKVAYGFKNKLSQDVTNIKLFYIETIGNGATLRYNNQNYTVTWESDVHLSNESINLTAVLPRVVFPDYWAFNYSDLISSNFEITDFFAGNASEFDAELPNQLIVAVAMTKGNGVLPSGATEWADPTIQGSLTSPRLHQENTRKLLVINTPCGNVFHVVYLNTSAGTRELRRALSLDGGNTWVNDTLIATDANYPSIVNDSNGNVHIAYRKATAGWHVYYVNGTKNATCGWSYTVPANIGTAAGSDYGVGWGYDYDGNLWKIQSRVSATYPNYSVTICPTTSNCSIKALWVAPDGNALGYTPLKNPAGNASGGPAMIARTASEVIVFTDNGYNAMACRFNRVAANNYSPDTYNILNCADIDGVAAGHYWPAGVSAAVNSSGVVWTAFQISTGVATKGVGVTRCASNCHQSASWVRVNGSQGYDNLFPDNNRKPVLGIFQDKPVVFFTNNEVTKDLLYRYVSGASWGGYNNATNTTYGSVVEPVACFKTADGFTPAIYMGVAFPNSTALTFLNFSVLLGLGGGVGGGFEFNQTSITYSSPAYETNPALFNVTVDYNTTNVSAVWYGHLVYDGVEFNASVTDNGSTVYFNKTHPAKFLTGSNNSAVYFRFSLHGNYSNGSAFVWNSSNYAQSVWYAWFWNAWAVAPTNLLAVQQALATMNTTQLYGTATVSAQIAWVGTNYSMAVDGFNFTREVTAPGFTTVFGAVGWLNVTYGSKTRINMTTNTSITVVSPSLVVCNATANQTILNFTSRSEESNATVNFSMDATFWLWDAARTVNTTYSSNWTNVAYVELCIYPNWASGQVDSVQQYYFAGYYPRSYFLDHAPVSNASTQNITLFLANNSLTKNTLFSLKDGNGLLLSGYTIVVERYYPATNTFETIAMMRTDSNGAGITYLVPNDASYVYVIVLDGEPVEIITPSAPIPCASALSQCTKELQLSNVLIGEYYQTAGQIAGNCSWNPSTNLTVCIVSDGSGLARSWRLTVTKLGLVLNNVTCVAVLNTSSGVLTCPVADDGEYSASLVALGSIGIVDSITFVKGALTSFFSADFVFLSLFVILAIGFAAIGSPAAGVFFLSMGVAFAKILGLLLISTGAVIMVVALGILIAWKLRT